MLNKCILIGRLTKTPELKSTQSNISYCNFTLAVNRQFADSSGERQADFLSCVVWRSQAENLVKYQSKGSLIAVEGRIETRSYEVDGQTRYATEIICDNIQYLESKKEETDGEYFERYSHKELVEASGEETTAASDDLPF